MDLYQCDVQVLGHMSSIKILHWVPAYGGSIDVRIAGQVQVDCSAMTKLGFGYQFWWTDSSDLPRSRNHALEMAIDKGFDYILMQDSDIYVPRVSPMAMLLQTAIDKQAVMTGAICGLRRISHDSVPPNVRPYKQGEVYEVERIGTGLVLIDCQQVAKWRDEYDGPWFARTYHDARQTSIDFGEDFFFCAICARFGGIMFADGRIPTVHAYTDHLHLRYPPEDTGGEQSP